MSKYLVLREVAGGSYQKIKSTELLIEARKTKEFYEKQYWRVIIARVIK